MVDSGVEGGDAEIERWREGGFWGGNDQEREGSLTFQR